MKKYTIVLLMILFIAGASVATYAYNLSAKESAALVESSDWVIKQAFLTKKSGLQVQGQGILTRLLADDLSGDRHQRFILRLNSGQTLLMAHNIDIAPRLDGLKIGGLIIFYGQYEWNTQGGFVHWTHHDLNSKHINGWLKYKNKTYQ
jgi:hypothetical protein